jgi:hypothetical protein
MSTPVEQLQEIGKSPVKCASIGAVTMGALGYGGAELMNFAYDNNPHIPPVGFAAYAGGIMAYVAYKLSKNSIKN